MQLNFFLFTFLSFSIIDTMSIYQLGNDFDLDEPTQTIEEEIQNQPEDDNSNPTEFIQSTINKFKTNNFYKITTNLSFFDIYFSSEETQKISEDISIFVKQNPENPIALSETRIFLEIRKRNRSKSITKETFKQIIEFIRKCYEDLLINLEEQSLVQIQQFSEKNLSYGEMTRQQINVFVQFLLWTVYQNENVQFLSNVDDLKNEILQKTKFSDIPLEQVDLTFIWKKLKNFIQLIKLYKTQKFTEEKISQNEIEDLIVQLKIIIKKNPNTNFVINRTALLEKILKTFQNFRRENFDNNILNYILKQLKEYAITILEDKKQEIQIQHSKKIEQNLVNKEKVENIFNDLTNILEKNQNQKFLQDEESLLAFLCSFYKMKKVQFTTEIITILLTKLRSFVQQLEQEKILYQKRKQQIIEEQSIQFENQANEIVNFYLDLIEENPDQKFLKSEQNLLEEIGTKFKIDTQLLDSNFIIYLLKKLRNYSIEIQNEIELSKKNSQKPENQELSNEKIIEIINELMDDIDNNPDQKFFNNKEILRDEISRRFNIDINYLNIDLVTEIYEKLKIYYLEIQEDQPVKKKKIQKKVNQNQLCEEDILQIIDDLKIDIEKNPTQKFLKNVDELKFEIFQRFDITNEELTLENLRIILKKLKQFSIQIKKKLQITTNKVTTFQKIKLNVEKPLNLTNNINSDVKITNNQIQKQNISDKNIIKQTSITIEKKVNKMKKIVNGLEIIEQEITPDLNLENISSLEFPDKKMPDIQEIIEVVKKYQLDENLVKQEQEFQNKTFQKIFFFKEQIDNSKLIPEDIMIDFDKLEEEWHILIKTWQILSKKWEQLTQMWEEFFGIQTNWNSKCLNYSEGNQEKTTTENIQTTAVNLYKRHYYLEQLESVLTNYKTTILQGEKIIITERNSIVYSKQFQEDYEEETKKQFMDIDGLKRESISLNENDSVQDQNLDYLLNLKNNLNKIKTQNKSTPSDQKWVHTIYQPIRPKFKQTTDLNSDNSNLDDLNLKEPKKQNIEDLNIKAPVRNNDMNVNVKEPSRTEIENLKLKAPEKTQFEIRVERPKNNQNSVSIATPKMPKLDKLNLTAPNVQMEKFDLQGPNIPNLNKINFNDFGPDMPNLDNKNFSDDAPEMPKIGINVVDNQEEEDSQQLKTPKIGDLDLRSPNSGQRQQNFDNEENSDMAVGASIDQLEEEAKKKEEQNKQVQNEEQKKPTSRRLDWRDSIKKFWGIKNHDNDIISRVLKQQDEKQKQKKLELNEKQENKESKKIEKNNYQNEKHNFQNHKNKKKVEQQQQENKKHKKNSHDQNKRNNQQENNKQNMKEFKYNKKKEDSDEKVDQNSNEENQKKEKNDMKHQFPNKKTSLRNSFLKQREESYLRLLENSLKDYYQFQFQILNKMSSQEIQSAKFKDSEYKILEKELSITKEIKNTQLIDQIKSELKKMNYSTLIHKYESIVMIKNESFFYYKVTCRPISLKAGKFISELQHLFQLLKSLENFKHDYLQFEQRRIQRNF